MPVVVLTGRCDLFMRRDTYVSNGVRGSHGYAKPVKVLETSLTNSTHPCIYISEGTPYFCHKDGRASQFEERGDDLVELGPVEPPPAKSGIRPWLMHEIPQDGWFWYASGLERVSLASSRISQFQPDRVMLFNQWHTPERLLNHFVWFPRPVIREQEARMACGVAVNE